MHNFFTASQEIKASDISTGHRIVVYDCRKQYQPKGKGKFAKGACYVVGRLLILIVLSAIINIYCGIVGLKKTLSKHPHQKFTLYKYFIARRGK